MRWLNIISSIHDSSNVEQSHQSYNIAVLQCIVKSGEVCRKPLVDRMKCEKCLLSRLANFPRTPAKSANLQVR